MVSNIILEQTLGANTEVLELTILSPTRAKFCTEKVEAVYLENTASAATPPLIALIRRYGISFVGFIIRI